MCKNYENSSIMAHGLHAIIKNEIGCSNNSKPRSMEQQQRPGGGTSSGAAGKMGSRRIFTPQFKLQVLDSYRNDSDCKGNQRATARKYGIHRRQIQKWLQVENNLRSAAANSATANTTASAMKINLMSSTSINSSSGNHHQPQFQLHPQHHHHHHHIHQHQNLNSIELKVPLDSTRHRVAQNASSNNNNNNNNNGHSKESSACIISPVPTHTTAGPVSFSHPHHETSSSSASLSVLKTHSRESAAAAAFVSASQVVRPAFSPVSGDFPVAPTPTHLPFDRLNLLDPYYHHQQHHYQQQQQQYVKYALDCPIDLSLPQQYRSKVEPALSPCSTISSLYSSRPESSSTPPATLDIKCEYSSRQLGEETDCEAVDLSCRKRKSNPASDDSADGPSPPKSVKLFKPYLLGDDKEDDKDDKDSSLDSPSVAGSPGRRPEYPIIWNFHAHQRYYESLYEYNSSPPYLATQQPPLTPIPRTTLFSSTGSSTSSSSILSPSPPNSSILHWAPPQASPVSGYDSSTSISSVYSNSGSIDGRGGDDGYSYSLELRQQAIDSYYHDVSCRGDFHAVASKYNINRKYVERWLAQEDHIAAAAPPPPTLPQAVVG
ncbi:uncharacterized protein LOC129768555 [Toxorhynchites rutilus septentrionalis]|uniref:uncharacterized protein LOC129768555 n=1 Tax=Toxorhynchites rutilus septentrionalis TaxID=329112 RepID=UPI002478C554|nr:uncharacterized protein LOC129768555 [Toxorhynchites rutilus septentrionalis]